MRMNLIIPFKFYNRSFYISIISVSKIFNFSLENRRVDGVKNDGRGFLDR